VRTLRAQSKEEKELTQTETVITTLSPFIAFLLSFVGSLLVYIMDASKGKNVFRFTTYFSKKNKTKITAKIVDMILFSLIGGVIGYFIGGPEKPAQAIMFGFGWTGLISSVQKDEVDEN